MLNYACEAGEAGDGYTATAALRIITEQSL